MTEKTLIVGSGIAGLTCAKLLTDYGWVVDLRDLLSSSSQALLLNKTTYDLLLDVWYASTDPFAILNTITEYKINWGTQNVTSVIKEPSLLIRKDLLIKWFIRRLVSEQKFRFTIDNSYDYTKLFADHSSISRLTDSFRWIIDATGRDSFLARKLGAIQHYTFGERTIISTEVAMPCQSDQHTMWLESIDEGWVYLAPLNEKKGILQIMIPGNSKTCSDNMIPDLIKQTHDIKFHISCAIGPASVFKAFPQMIDPMCGPNWIAVGDAALSWDPLSGDGVGYAVRGAILAAAVLRGIDSGLPESECLHHYSARLHKMFISHLNDCYTYYSKAFHSDIWKQEIDLMSRPYPHILADMNQLIYGINGFDLTPLDSS